MRESTREIKFLERTVPSLFCSRISTLQTSRWWYVDLIRPKLPGFFRSAARVVVGLLLPLLLAALILYYAVGNPIAGSHLKRSESASWSWWVLFVLRQAVVLSAVRAGEVISIDILALRTPVFLRLFGSFATLMIVQARGWPYVTTFWALSDFCVLFGKLKFPRQ